MAGVVVPEGEEFAGLRVRPPHVQLSPALLGALVLAIGATAGLIVALVTYQAGPPPRPDGGPPPPPPGAALLVVTTGLFVLGWLATVVVVARDQLLRRFVELREATRLVQRDYAEQRRLFADLREELAVDRQAAYEELAKRVLALTAEYAEQRETDGYVKGMRIGAELTSPTHGEVRPLRRVPPTG